MKYAVFATCKQELENNVKAAKPSTKKGGGRVSKKGKETPGVDVSEDHPMPQKAATAMKKRGEECEESKYIGEELCLCQPKIKPCKMRMV